MFTNGFQLQVVDSSFAIINDFVAKTGGPVDSISMNTTYDNYIIIAVGALSLTSTSKVSFAKLNINA